MDKHTITKRNQRNMLADSILDHTSLDQSMRFGLKAGLAVEENGHKKDAHEEAIRVWLRES